MTKEIIYQQALAEACTELADARTELAKAYKALVNACAELAEIKEELRQFERAKELFMDSLYNRIQVLEDKHNIVLDIYPISMWMQSRESAQKSKKVVVSCSHLLLKKKQS